MPPILNFTNYMDSELYNWEIVYDQYYDHYHNEEGMHSLSLQEYKMMQNEYYLFHKLSWEIDEEVSQITYFVELVQQYRFEIQSNIQKIAEQTFSSDYSRIEAHIFGSVATELALPESDMDIVITGVNNYGGESKLHSNITSLYDNIKNSFSNSVLIKHKKILNTQIPIIKLVFSLPNYFEECNKYWGNRLPHINFDSVDLINANISELSVDISISDSFNETSHLGLYQTNYVIDRLYENPVLGPVWLVLKKLLLVNDLNNPYTGGLGSFSLFVMLYAALNFERMNSNALFQEDDVYKGRLFAYFLSYYGDYFDVEYNAIFFDWNSMPIILPKLNPQCDTSSFRKTLIVYDPTNCRNNTTQKTFRYEEIERLFSKTKKRIRDDFSEMIKNKSFQNKLLNF